MKILIKLLLPFLFVPILGFGQGYDSGGAYDTLSAEARIEITKQAIKDLKNGVLVVRLKTGNSQLKALERVANSPSVSEEEKEKFKIKIVSLKKEIQLENESLIQSMKENYFFSEVLYIADTTVYLLKENNQHGYFLNEKMEVDKSISLNDKSYLIAYYGATASSTKSGVEGIVVLGRDFKELADPFPHFTGITTARKELGKFFKKRTEMDYYKLMVQRFENRLNELYELNN